MPYSKIYQYSCWSIQRAICVLLFVFCVFLLTFMGWICGLRFKMFQTWDVYVLTELWVHVAVWTRTQCLPSTAHRYTCAQPHSSSSSSGRRSTGGKSPFSGFSGGVSEWVSDWVSWPAPLLLPACLPATTKMLLGSMCISRLKFQK